MNVSAAGTPRRWRLMALPAVLVLALALALSACTTGSDSSQGEGTGVAATDAGGDTTGDASVGTIGANIDMDSEGEHPVAGLVGKRIGMVPVGRGLDLTEGWIAALQQGADAYGMELIVRDPDWDPEALVSAVRSLIDEEVDVLVVHNQDLTSTASIMEDAEESGIYVISIGQVSNYIPTAHVGGEYRSMSYSIATDIAEACPDGKVAMIQGDAAAGGTTEQVEGAMEVFDATEGLEVVASQPANWDPTQAHDITATVLQQHPDLCAVYGFWDQMSIGAVQAVDEAGLSDQVKVYTLDSSDAVACEGVRNGDFEAAYSFGAAMQGAQAFGVASFLLQSGIEPGSIHTGVWGSATRIDAESITDPNVAKHCY